MSSASPGTMAGSSVPVVTEHAHAARLGPLDGWRAVSILLVLAGHMFPLGPKSWQLNELATVCGMSLFFTLSGFLITSTLERNPTVASFLIRRFCRIVPLGLLASAIYLIMQTKGPAYYPCHLLFYVNYDDAHITNLTGHFWSLSVEVQFYLMAALTFGLFGIRGLGFLASLGLAVTAFRVFAHDPTSNRTHLRIDEILSGVGLALCYSGRFGLVGRMMQRWIIRVPLLFWAILFLISCHRSSGPLLYGRNYLAAALVGRSLLVPDHRLAWLESRPMRYLAEISFALYVIHVVAGYGWLNSGDKVTKYLKRPISLAIIFALAHLSTFYYERSWIALGKRWARSWDIRRKPVRPPEPAHLLDP